MKLKTALLGLGILLGTIFQQAQGQNLSVTGKVTNSENGLDMKNDVNPRRRFRSPRFTDEKNIIQYTIQNQRHRVAMFRK